MDEEGKKELFMEALKAEINAPTGGSESGDRESISRLKEKAAELWGEGGGDARIFDSLVGEDRENIRNGSHGNVKKLGELQNITNVLPSKEEPKDSEESNVATIEDGDNIEDIPDLGSSFTEQNIQQVSEASHTGGA